MEMETRTGIKRDREIDRQTTDREREGEKKYRDRDSETLAERRINS